MTRPLSVALDQGAQLGDEVVGHAREVVVRAPVPVAAGEAVVERAGPRVEDRLADGVRVEGDAGAGDGAGDVVGDLLGGRRERGDVVDAAGQALARGGGQLDQGAQAV